MATASQPRRRKKKEPLLIRILAPIVTVVLWPVEKVMGKKRPEEGARRRPASAMPAASAPISSAAGVSAEDTADLTPAWAQAGGAGIGEGNPRGGTAGAGAKGGRGSAGSGGGAGGRPSRTTARRRRLVLVGCLAAVVLVLAAVAGDYLLSRGSIHGNVTVYGVGVGGMKASDAKFKLSSALPTGGQLKLVYKGHVWTISADALKTHIDGRAAAHAAYLYTRSGNLFTQAWRRFSLWFTPHDIRPPLSLDSPRFKQQLAAIAQVAEVKPVAATVKVVGATPTVRPAKDGRVIDVAAVRRALTQAALSGDEVTVKLPLVTATPAVATADAQTAAATARAWLAGPLTLVYQDHTYTLPPDELGQYLAFVPQEGSPRLKVTFDSPVTQGYFDYITAQIGKPGKDAQFVVHGAKVSIEPGKAGWGVVPAKTIERMNAAASGGASGRSVQIVVGKAPPELSAAEARALHITRQIGTYTTSVAGTTNRLDNVGLGSSMLNNTLIAPGKIFSVNGTTGERTAAAGFKMAPTIINGKLEDSVGGGMCQVSTTVFNAAFVAGLQIVERHNHALYISHYPLGRDATVSYGSYDLKFRNDTPDWILVKTNFTGYSLTVSLYSSPLHRKVVSTTSAWYNIVPFTITKKKDPTLDPGQTSVDTPGENGMSIDCYRKVYEDGKLIWNDDFKSVYSMAPEILLVGPKSPSPSPSPSPSASGSAKPSPTPKPSPTH